MTRSYSQAFSRKDLKLIQRHLKNHDRTLIYDLAKRSNGLTKFYRIWVEKGELIRSNKTIPTTIIHDHEWKYDLASIPDYKANNIKVPAGFKIVKI
jgi:hypothetical protein